MISCITLKNDTFKQFKIKNVDEENIYKKCGYKSSNNFSKLYTWTIDTSVELELWSKVDNASKVYNQHSIFLKYAISVNSNNKCIFLLKSNNNYTNLDGKYFNEFFNLKEVIETETISNANANANDADANTNANDANDANTNDANTNDAKTLKNLEKNLDKNEGVDVNSELSYELYSYSDEETDIS